MRDHTFVAAISPIIASRPISYVWQADEHSPMTYTGQLTHNATFNWSSPGEKTVTVTAINAINSLSKTQVINLTTLPTPPVGVSISGATTGDVQKTYTFTATVSPLTATQPISYMWQASGQAPVTHTGGTTIDTVIFSWNSAGPKTIVVTATNAAGTVKATHHTVIAAPACCNTKLYLPIILKASAGVGGSG